MSDSQRPDPASPQVDNHPHLEYRLGSLLEAEVDPHPIRQFALWYEEAERGGLVEPYRMVLATVASDGQPSARIVLMRGFDDDGFRFFTNYESRKGKELTQNPKAALVFDWYEQQRQVRIEGLVEQLPTEQSEAYYRGRPTESKLGAWASAQSEVLSDRVELEKRLIEVKERFGDAEIPKPPNWGGYRLRPVRIEFWQGRPARLHDRLCYQQNASDHSSWEIIRLSP